MTEAELRTQVLELAERAGLEYILSVPDSRRILHGIGFPDLMIVGPRMAFFRELKSEGGQLSKDQRRWRYALESAGLNFAVWRPADLASGAIWRELVHLAQQR